MITLTIELGADTSWESDFTVQAFTDFGDGSIDETIELFSQALALFPGVHWVGGYGEVPYGEGTYGGEKAVYAQRGGYGEIPYGEDADGYGEGTPFISLDVPIDQDAVGDWLFGVKVIDGAGNVQSDAIVEFTFHVSGQDPDPPQTFDFSSFNSGTSVFTFDIAQ